MSLMVDFIPLLGDTQVKALGQVELALVVVLLLFLVCAVAKDMLTLWEWTRREK